MGGNALKHLGVRRFKADEYAAVTDEVSECFEAMFSVKPVLIPSYCDKADFGDADFLVASDKLPQNWWVLFAEAYGSAGWVDNNTVVSIEYQQLQVDFITVPQSHFARALTYYSFNDLGNLMGRVANSLGFKYGHLGLTKTIRDGDHVIAELEVTDNIEDIFDFLGYDKFYFDEDFSTLNDIFTYVESSPHFHPDIYLLHNLNATSRIRDAKRETYTKFLKWCEFRRSPEMLPYDNTPAAKAQRHAVFLEEAYVRWPDFERRANEFIALHKAQKERKTRWNGDNVMAWTSLNSGVRLGKFMAFCQEFAEFERVEHDLGLLRAYVLAKYKEFLKNAN